MNLATEKMSFEDLTFILNGASEETISEFFGNIQTYIPSDDFFSFLNFVIKNDKKLLEKFKLNKEISKIILSL
ncbi:hypothetical protein [Candidatus Sulfurimonas baltica]|uniref:Uncharacterized protein n=1 Tax=Candidatus Sulfurimonas baltica TaxID=2740404 RepID=A0A7S7LSX4_9BACT|nr:hypothetical protein [Candidatus Sulfurimonas baltica]QOY50949.1 hypothetical protein HUE88_07270 [Candidatus Sulfurimonas baltica]